MTQKGVYAALFEKQTQGGESVEEIKIWSSIKWVLSTNSVNGWQSTVDSRVVVWLGYESKFKYVFL